MINIWKLFKLTNLTTNFSISYNNLKLVTTDPWLVIWTYYYCRVVTTKYRFRWFPFFTKSMTDYTSLLSEKMSYKKAASYDYYHKENFSSAFYNQFQLLESISTHLVTDLANQVPIHKTYLTGLLRFQQSFF